MCTSVGLMQCPWCGHAFWQVTDAAGTAKFLSHAECFHCGYRYEARFDPASGKIVVSTTPGTRDCLPGVASDTLGPPEELTPEHWKWICDQLADEC